MPSTENTSSTASQIPLRVPESEIMRWAMASAGKGSCVGILARSIQEQEDYYRDAIMRGEHVVESYASSPGQRHVVTWNLGRVDIFVMQAPRGHVYDFVLRPWPTR